MSSIRRISSIALAALKVGRAIPFLIDYRPPELPKHTLSVVGLLDSLHFEAVLVDDRNPDCDLERLNVPCGPLSVGTAPLSSEDAQATHNLWSMWTSGVRSDCLRLLRLLAHQQQSERFLAALDWPGQTPAQPRMTVLHPLTAERAIVAVLVELRNDNRKAKVSRSRKGKRT